MDRVRISYFTDALCVWAYVSQVRIDELKANFKEAIEFDYRYFHVFGNVANKMDTAWKEPRGSACLSEACARHRAEVWPCPASRADVGN